MAGGRWWGVASRSRGLVAGNFGGMLAGPGTALGAGDRVAPVRVGLAGRYCPSKGSAGRRRGLGGYGRLVGVLVSGVLLVAQCGLDGGDGSDDGGGLDGGDGAPAAASEGAATSGAEAPAATATTIAPAAPGPASPETAAPPEATETVTPAGDGQEVPQALSGPPPVAVGTMPELRIDPGSRPHALFVGNFFRGPVEGFSAASSDTGVARAGVTPPDMLVVAPGSRGSASVTVTASGPGGVASQTFTVRVGTTGDGSQVAAPPAPAPAPAPAPPAPTPPAPFVPVDELPPAAAPPPPGVPEETLPGQAAPPDDQSLYSLATEPVTEPPEVSTPIPDQTLIVGNSGTVNVRPYFSGIVQGWAVASSVPASVAASVDNTGVVSISGSALGTSTITVTAANDAGSVAYGFTVSVKTTSQVVLSTVGNSPQLLVQVGRTVAIDISRFFSEAAIEFDVTYDSTDPNRLVDVTVQGSVASIQAIRTGTTKISLVATSATATITRPATIQVTG